MSNKSIVGIVVVLVLILGGTWWSLSKRGDEVNVPVDNNDEQTTTPQSITVNHYFDNGNHSIEGTLTLPTPCHSLSHEVTVAESSPEQVMIKFTTTPGEGICTQVLSDKFFRVTFAASAEAKISATLNGSPLRLIFSENKEGITK